MPKRSRTTAKPESDDADDPNVTAFRVLQQAIGEIPRQDGPKAEPPAGEGKNPAAVALGRLGGLKGGAARAKKLSKKKRAEIAKKAARARWSPKRK